MYEIFLKVLQEYLFLALSDFRQVASMYNPLRVKALKLYYGLQFTVLFF